MPRSTADPPRTLVPFRVTRAGTSRRASTNDGETINTGMFSFLDTWGAVPNGYSYGQDESPFVNSGSSVDAWESFHPWEWRNAMLNHYAGAIDTHTPYTDNCMSWY